MTLAYHYFAAASDDDAVQLRERDEINGSGIEPTVNLGDLEELLTGVDYDRIAEDPRAGETLARQDDQGMVITVTDALQAALSRLDDNRLAPLAAEWSHAEDFGGETSPGDLRVFLTDLSRLATRALERNERLYCRVRF